MKKEQMEALQTIIKAPIMLAACFDALEKGIQLKNPEKVDALIDDLESAVPIVEKWMRGEKSQKNPHHEIGQMAFDLIPIANRLIAGKSQDVFRDAMDIQKGLHAIEFKACRWADDTENTTDSDCQERLVRLSDRSESYLPCCTPRQ